MRILQIASSLDPRSGGPAFAVTGLSRALRDAGMDVTIAATFGTAESKRTAESLGADGVNVELMEPAGENSASHPPLIPTLERLIGQSDIVHINALWEEIQHRAARICLGAGVPYVITPHGMLDPWSLSQRWLKKKIYLALRMRKNLDRAAAIHYTSSIERDLAGRLKLKPPSIVEPNGLDLQEFISLPPPGKFRERFSTIGDRRIILFLSRLHYKKGLDLLIPAFAKVREQLRDIVLVIAGPDSDHYQSKLEELARAQQLMIGEDVIFTGMLRGRERVEAYVDAELFTLPSYQENFGIVVAEALAASCPVVISDQVNIHREIRQANVGAVVPTQVEPLAHEILSWLNDPAKRRAAAEAARPFVWSRYDWKVISEHWAEHYARLMRANQE